MHLRTLFIAIALSISALTLQAQSVKDIMLDKSGTYIYAQARDADISKAEAAAAADLNNKVISYCKNAGLPVPSAALKADDSNVVRIDGEVSGQHRVFLYVLTSSLRNAQPKNDPPKSELQKADTPKSEPQKADTPKSEPQRVVAPKVAPKVDGESLASDILKQTSAQGVLSCLEKGKSAMQISNYGQRETKFMRHCYLITIVDGRLHVYSPQNDQGQRKDYATGQYSNATEGPLLFWYLKK